MKTSFYVKSLPPVPLGLAEERDKDKEYLGECKKYGMKFRVEESFPARSRSFVRRFRTEKVFLGDLFYIPSFGMYIPNFGI